MQNDYCCTCGKTSLEAELDVLLKEFNELHKLDLLCEKTGKIDTDTGEILEEKSKMVKYFDNNSWLFGEDGYSAECEKWFENSYKPKYRRYLEIWSKIEELGGKVEDEV
jgi:hypothetical protein